MHCDLACIMIWMMRMWIWVCWVVTVQTDPQVHRYVCGYGYAGWRLCGQTTRYMDMCEDMGMLGGDCADRPPCTWIWIWVRRVGAGEQTTGYM